MTISPISTFGLPGTAQAIQQAQGRFDDAAEQVVADTMVAASDTPSADTLASDMVSMKAESITNSILYGLFRRQSEQQQDLLKLMSPSTGA